MRIAKGILEWIRTECWNGEYFAAVADKRGKVLDGVFYPRTNAWVFHSIAHCVRGGALQMSSWEAIIEQCYSRLERCDYSGLERNISSRRLRMALAVRAGWTGKSRDLYREEEG